MSTRPLYCIRYESGVDADKMRKTLERAIGDVSLATDEENRCIYFFSQDDTGVQLCQAVNIIARVLEIHLGASQIDINSLFILLSKKIKKLEEMKKSE